MSFTTTNIFNKDLILTLWRDNTKEGEELEIKLRDFGYEIKTILSGSIKPIVSYDKYLISGYSNINIVFEL